MNIYFKRILQKIHDHIFMIKIEESIEILTISAITSSKFKETASFWTKFKENFDGIRFIKRTNFITHRTKIKTI